MNIELLLLKFIQMLPDGKYSVPMNLTVDKLGSSAILSFKVQLNESDMLPMQEGDAQRKINDVHSDRGQDLDRVETSLS